MTGICAEVRVDGPAVCQLASMSGGAGGITGVSRSSTPDAGGTVTEEFTVQDDAELVWGEDLDTEPVFSYGDSTVYRFSRSANQGCVCELVEQTGCTVRQIQILDGSIVVTFLATDLQSIRDVVGDLRDAHEGVHVRRLTRSAADGEEDPAVVDMNALTCRQEEVLQTAYEMGYFEHPKAASAGDVAAALDIATPTFTEHLAAAQRKLLDELLADADRPRSMASTA